MKFKKELFVLVFFVAALYVDKVYPYTHRRPVPDIPREINIYQANDVFTTNLITQIHETLFVLERNGPVPNLIKDFSVSADQKTYNFALRDLYFHNGDKLTNEDIKKVFEEVIRKRAVGYEKLSGLKGYNEFISGNAMEVQGLVILGDSLMFEIHLTKPVPNLIYFLSEFRFSIVKFDGHEHRIGLGDYKIHTMEKDKIVLNLVNKKLDGVPDVIEYIKSSKLDAFNGFAEDKYHDIFLYHFDFNELKDFTGVKNVQDIFSPRTYVLVLDASSFTNLEYRRTLFRKINRKNLIDLCYTGNELTNSLIPPGFLGYLNIADNKNSPDDNMTSESNGAKLVLGIAEGVGNEICAQDFFNREFKNNISIKIDNTSDLLKMFKSGQINALFVYLESENTLDFFQFFNPNSEFMLGEKNDEKILGLIGEFNDETDPILKNEKALELSKHINQLYTVLPFFSPKQFLAYDFRYKPLNLKVKSPTLIKFTEFKIKE